MKFVHQHVNKVYRKNRNRLRQRMSPKQREAFLRKVIREAVREGIHHGTTTTIKKRKTS
ncbi:hypothetical protein KJ765_05975 [Candidatus Micrarchaeota archaeon]|nr:hypothetical protein [Candidatus Micrarchaeota archaeon]